MKLYRSTQTSESGQAIILIAFIFIGLVAVVGITVDLGRYLAAQTQFRRAADAAALAGSAQFRLSGSTLTQEAVYDRVNQAARAMLSAHNVPSDTLASGVYVDTCYSSTDLCSVAPEPPTKKVRVRVNGNLDLIFLSVIGWRTVPLDTEATSEAASVDVALVIDISDSMANDVCAGSDFPCQYTCQQNRNCQPFEKVREAALAFLDYLSPGYDRVTVIPFALEAGYCINQGDVWPECGKSAFNTDNPVAGWTPVYLQMPWSLGKITSNIQDARDFITNLEMAIPRWATDAGGVPIVPVPACPGYNEAEGWDPRQCMNTNPGGGIRAATNELLKELDPAFPVPGAGPNHPAKDHLRVIILLTDGAPNASGLGAEAYPDYGSPSGGAVPGFCPRSTWYPVYANTGPFCRAAFPGFTTDTGRHTSGDVEYDSVDYVLDWADFAMLEPPAGSGVVVFTIGLGDKVINENKGDPQIGEKLLRYMAAGGDDGKLSTDLCAGVASGASCGNYYFAPDKDQLLKVFQAIAGRIFTRINQ